MNRQNNIFLYIVIMAIATIFLAGCPNNLVDKIDEEVKVVVTPPSIVSIYPESGAASVAIDDDILITFTKQIDLASVNGASFVVKDQYGSNASGRYDVTNDTITFSPNNLFFNTTYTVSATAAILDLDGNQFLNEFTWTFTTQSAPAGIKPIVQSFNINNGKSATSSSNVTLGVLATDYLGAAPSLQFRYKLETDSDWSGWIDIDGGIGSVDVELLISEGIDETFVYQAEVRDLSMVVSELAYTQITYKTSSPSIDENLSNPSPGTTDSQSKTYIKVAFDCEMDTGTITPDSVYISKGITKISTYQFTFTDNRTAIEFTEFALAGTPDIPYYLEQNTDYTVFISSSVSDIAGNTFASDYSYTFSNGSFDDNTPPEGKVVLDLDNPELNATGSTVFDLMINASDDFNGVRSVKIWGDSNNSATFPYDEQNASWKHYLESSTTVGSIDYMSYNTAYEQNWSLDPSNEGDNYIYYKFIDYANNESLSNQSTGLLIVSYDGTDPELTGMQINSGSGYTNNTNDTVNITLQAQDLTTVGSRPGSGLRYMWLSSEASTVLNKPLSNSGSWEPWSALKTSYPLDSGEGQYYIYAEVQDFVNKKSGTAGSSGIGSSSVILDYTDPVVTFSGNNILEVNSIRQQTVTIEDPYPGVSAYQIPSDIATYSWEQLSGPGTLEFYSDSGGTNSDTTVYQPYIKASASDGSEDGTYEIKVTAVDNAGNSSFNTVNFTWDTVDPGDIGTITAYNADGTQLTTSAENGGGWVYTTSAQPYATWAATQGADFYTIIPNNTTTDPNDSTTPAPRYWDYPLLDWNNPATYSSGYIRNDNPIVSAPAPDNPGDNDGPTYLYAAAWDNAGNRSNRTTNQYVKFWIDTLAPAIINLKTLPQSNSPLTLDYRNSDDGGDGRVYDQRTSDDPTPGTDGSGIASYLWTQSEGPGTLTIQNPTTLAPTVSASADGQYELELSVSDMAGNTYEGYTNFIWDTIAPNAPSVSGTDHTPNLDPTWFWNGQGGGNGYFRYRMERVLVNGTGSPIGTTEEIRLPGDDGFSPYWVTDSTALNYSLTCSNSYKYTLYIQERDDAGNWSGSNSQTIWTDTSYTSEPTITRSGVYLRNALDRTVTWTWTTGLGGSGDEYRYRLIDSSNTVIIDYWDNHYAANTLTVNFATYNGGLLDDEYTLEVEEYNTSGAGSWVNKVGSSSVEIDATAPNAPTMRLAPYSTGITTSGDSPDYYLTNDNTPRLWWLGDATGGSGNYRWNFDGGTWTNTSSYYIYSDVKSDNAYIFYVQERDTAGNWSASASYKLEIDTTAPTLTSILLHNRSLNAYNTTIYTVGTSVNIDVTGSGTNLQTYTGSDIRYMKFWNSGGTKYTYNFNSSLNGWNFSNGSASTADGSKTVYCELVDYAGNVSVSRLDSITLDTIVPPVSSFSINSGTTTSSSSSVTLNSTLTDDAYAMRISNDGGSTWSVWYGDSTAKSWTLSTNPGAKKVMVQFTDIAGYYCRNTSSQLAGHDTDVQDSIFYGTPVLRYSDKGKYNYGRIRTYYENFASDTGSANTYYVYYAYSPTGSKYLKGYTTNTLYYYNDTYAKGTLYYLFMRVYNPDIGWSNYTPYTVGFSSDVTIVYDDNDTDDTSLAGTIKSRLTYDWASQYSYVLGTMPVWTVTKLPEDLIDNTKSVYGETTIYGDPVIITPGVYSYSSQIHKMHNMAAGGKGVLGMNYTGSKFMHYVDYYVNAGTWTDVGSVKPASLGSAVYKGTTRYAGTAKDYSYHDYIWFFGYHYVGHGLYYSSYFDNNRYTQTDAQLFSADKTKYSVYRTESSGTDGVYLLGYDKEYTNYYTVAREGRFAFWGYNDVPNTIGPGIPFFINVVGKLNYFY